MDLIPMQPEEFELVTNALNLWGADREALRLGCVERVPVAEIPAALGVDAEVGAALLESAYARVQEYAWPSCRRQVLEAMRGPASACPPTPAFQPSEYDGLLRRVVIRSPVVSEADSPGDPWRSEPADLLGRGLAHGGQADLVPAWR